MAKKEVKWSLRAINDKLAIYEYWNKHNKSSTYSIKLDKLFNEAVNLLSNFPTAGPSTNYKDVRVKNLRKYQIFYKVTDDAVIVLSIWDSRQNPKKLEL